MAARRLDPFVTNIFCLTKTLSIFYAKAKCEIKDGVIDVTHGSLPLYLAITCTCIVSYMCRAVCLHVSNVSLVKQTCLEMSNKGDDASQH